MFPFTAEEINLMCIYTSATRRRLLVDLRTAYLNIFDDELQRITLSAIRKLEEMTDDQYAEIAPSLEAAEEFTGEEE